MKSTVPLIVVCWLWQGVAAGQQDRTCWLRDGTSPAPSLVYLLCEQGGVLVTSDAGATWSARATSTAGHLRNVDFIDANRGFAVGDDGLLVATADGGRKWEIRKTGVTQNLTSIQFVGNAGWAVGYDGVILHTADGGLTWSVQQTGTKEALENLYFLVADHGWVVGWAGMILITADGGNSWRQLKTDVASWSLSAVYFRDLQNGWIVGFGGQILRSRDGGVTWTALKSPTQSWLTSIAFDKSKHGWIAADEGLLVSEDAGETWRAVNVDDRLFLSQLITVDGSLWAIGQLGVLRQDAGSHWKKVDSLVTDDPTRDSEAPTASTASRVD